MHPSTPAPRLIRRPWLARAALVLLVGAAGVAAAAGLQHGGGRSHHGGAHAALEDPAGRAAHIDGMLKHVYAEIGATDAQQRQLEPIFRRAADQFVAMHQAADQNHAIAHEVLGQEKVDRTALEAVRLEYMQQAEQRSRALAAFAADVADVLTPAQRHTLMRMIAQHFGGDHG